MNKIKDAFSQIHAEESLKQRTAGRVLSKRKRIPLALKILPVATAVAIAVFAGLFFIPYSFISIDINPSIELEANTFGIVINVSAVNEDAVDIVESADVWGMSYTDAIDTIASTDEFSGYSDSPAEITVISPSSEMIDEINQTEFVSQGNVTCYSSGSELKEQADELGISFGKYRSYLELLELNPGVKFEDVVDLPTGVIRRIIENGGVIDDEISSFGGGQGNGYGGGNGHGNGQGGNGNGQSRR